MNLTAIIFEQLDWHAQLKTLTFKPKEGADLWVARFDEYQDPRSGPFHILEPEQEREFAHQLQHARSRRTGRYEELGGGSVRFNTEWRGIPTERSGLSCYALCLPEDGVPDSIEFSDPHQSGRLYRYHAAYDDKVSRVVCYLECRSSYGSFDFDLSVTLHRDSRACRSFTPIAEGHDIGGLRELTDWIASAEDKIVIQQFFQGSKNMQMGDGGLMINETDMQGSTAIGTISGNTRNIDNHAHGNMHSIIHFAAMAKLAEKVRSSTWVKISGLIALIAVVTATVLLMTGVTDIGVAGYAVALISLLAAIIPLFSG